MASARFPCVVDGVLVTVCCCADTCRVGSRVRTRASGSMDHVRCLPLLIPWVNRFFLLPFAIFSSPLPPFLRGMLLSTVHWKFFALFPLLFSMHTAALDAAGWASRRRPPPELDRA